VTEPVVAPAWHDVQVEVASVPVRFLSEDRVVKPGTVRLLRRAAAHEVKLDQQGPDGALMTYGELCKPFGLHPLTQSGVLCWDLAEFFIDRYTGLVGRRLMLPALVVSAATRLPGYYEDPEHGFWAKVYDLDFTGVPVNTPAADAWLDEEQRSLVRAAKFLKDSGEVDRLENEAKGCT
jgi:hypothetical protein